MENLKLTIGQKVVLRPLSNATRSNYQVVEAEITKIGNKNFYVKSELPTYGRIEDTPFGKDDFLQIKKDYRGNTYSPEYKIYTSMKAIEDERNHPIILKELTDKLAKMSVDRLIELNKIIAE
jgi:hypothetical protein